MMGRPVSVISPNFCFAHHPIDLAISKKIWQMGSGNFVVNDGNHIMFKVEGSFFSFDRTRVILDSAGMPIVTLRKKTFTQRSRWQVFRGESTEDKDLIFSARRSSMIQFTTKLHVFLANNTSEDVCDYTVKGSGSYRPCQVYVGDSSTIIAQMHKNYSAGSIFTGKDRFMVTVSPNIDCAFIVALIVILDDINTQKKRSNNTHHAHHHHAHHHHAHHHH